MTGLPWFKCFPQDLLNGMAGMPADERGVYISVLCLIYREGAPIRDEPREVAYNAGCSVRQWLKCRDALLAHGKLKVVQVNGRNHLSNDRCDEEIEAQNARRESLSERGLNGAKKRHEKSETKSNEINGDGLASAMAEPWPILADTELDKDIPPTPLKGEAKGRRSPRKALPAEFPTPELIEEQQLKARDAGADLDVSAEAERFRNHALSTDRRCVDWSAAWRNWVLKAIGWAPKLAGFASPLPPEEDPWRLRLLRWKTAAYWNSEWGPKPDRPGYLGPPLDIAA